MNWIGAVLFTWCFSNLCLVERGGGGELIGVSHSPPQRTVADLAESAGLGNQTQLLLLCRVTREPPLFLTPYIDTFLSVLFASK